MHDSSGPEVQRPNTLTRAMFIDGVLWSIYERPPQNFDRTAGPSLIFESDTMVRRVKRYPSNWRELSGTALAALWDTT
jgi:hypothetical protein